MKRLTALTAAAATLVTATSLAACASDDDFGTDVTKASVVNEQKDLGADFKVSKLTVSDTCAYGIRFGGGTLDPGEGNHVLHLWTDVNDVKLPDDWQGDFVMAVLDTDYLINGQTRKAEPEYQCETAPDADDWTTGIKPGQKRKIFADFVIPKDAEKFIIDGQGFDLADIKEEGAPSEEGKPSTPVQPGTQPEPAGVAAPAVQQDVTLSGDHAADNPPMAEPDPLSQVPANHPNRTAIEQSLRESAGKTIDHCGDPGMHETGTTFFTDGTTGWTPDCASQMM